MTSLSDSQCYNSKTIIFTAHLFDQIESNNYYLNYIYVNY